MVMTSAQASQCEWLRIEAPDLKIVDQELWLAVEARREKAATAFTRTRQNGQLLGRASRLDGDSPYLLTGFTACSVCGGAIGGSTQYHGSGPVENRTRVTFYLCTMRRKRGACICSNDVVIRTDAVDTAVIRTINEVLDSRVIEKSIELAITRLEGGRDRMGSQRDRLKAELDEVESRLARLVEALVNGGPMETIVAQIKVEEERKRGLTAEYEALDETAAPELLDYATIVRELRARTADVQAVLKRQTSQARQMLRKLLDGKIAVEPITVDGQRGFRLSGRLNVGRLLRADVLRVVEAALPAAEDNSPTVVAPTGFEPVFEPRHRRRENPSHAARGSCRHEWGHPAAGSGCSRAAMVHGHTSRSHSSTSAKSATAIAASSSMAAKARFDLQYEVAETIT